MKNELKKAYKELLENKKILCGFNKQKHELDKLIPYAIMIKYFKLQKKITTVEREMAAIKQGIKLLRDRCDEKI